MTCLVKLSIRPIELRYFNGQRLSLGLVEVGNPDFAPNGPRGRSAVGTAPGWFSAKCHLRFECRDCSHTTTEHTHIFWNTLAKIGWIGHGDRVCSWSKSSQVSYLYFTQASGNYVLTEETKYILQIAAKHNQLSKR